MSNGIFNFNFLTLLHSEILGGPLGMQWPPIYVVWWKNYGDTVNTLVCTHGKEITEKSNDYAVRVTFHPCAALTPLNPWLPRGACWVLWST